MVAVRWRGSGAATVWSVAAIIIVIVGQVVVHLWPAVFCPIMTAPDVGIGKCVCKIKMHIYVQIQVH